MTEQSHKVRLEIGEDAPDFTLTDQNEKKITLSDLQGKPVVVYFYPRNFTPGCTREAQSFADLYSEFKKIGAEVIGISPDNQPSHLKFTAKYELPFLLGADEERTVLKSYGAWGIKKRFGKESEGVIRSTFIVDPTGKIFKLWRSVKVNGHVEKVLEQVSKLVAGR